MGHGILFLQELETRTFLFAQNIRLFAKNISIHLLKTDILNNCSDHQVKLLQTTLKQFNSWLKMNFYEHAHQP